MADITGTPSNDTLIGTAGDDFILGLEGDDTILGLEGNDQLLGNEGADTIDGGADHDFVRGDDGNDTLLGGSGDDLLYGMDGDDFLDGGAGFDRVGYRTGATAGVTVDLNIQGVAQDTGRGLDTLDNIEHVSGTGFDDTLTGNAGDNWLWGESGSDTIAGGAGDDLVQVGAGAVTADGGRGVDALSFAGDAAFSLITADGVTVSLLLQGAAQDTEQGLMTLDGFENLSGSNFADTLTGDRRDNVLAGDSGDDTLDGGRGDDTLLGDGRITIDLHGTGNSGPIVTVTDVGLGTFPSPVGNDVLDGGQGRDVLNGGGGDDVLTGGQGRDVFAIGSASGDDRVTDFHDHQDTIRFEGVAGVNDFSDLTISALGSDVLVTWGDGSNSLVLEGVSLAAIGAADFAFI